MVELSSFTDNILKSFKYKRSPVPSPQSKYAVIVDAGSSGSRLFVYEWPDPVEYGQIHSQNQTIQQSLPPLHLDKAWNKKTSPGISSYVSSDIDDIWSHHLKDLVRHAQSVIPSKDHSTTPFFFLATAGMRLLSDQDQTRLLSQVCSLLTEKTDFYLPECGTHVAVIDGETEGLYGWLALNYLLGPGRNYNDDDEFRHSYGFMDMGGASAQIAFSPNKTETQRHLDDLYHINLRTMNGENHSWKVFVSTWLGFGANEARKRLSELLLLTSTQKKSIQPPRAENHQLSLDYILDPCTPVGYSFKYNGNSTAIFHGTGNFDQCLNRLIPLLNKGLPCKDDPCLFNGIHVPAIDFNSDKLVGVSEYWYTANDIFDMGGKYDFTKFSSKAKQFCSIPWDTIVTNSDNGVYKNMPREYLSTACFKAAWIVNILHEGFGVPINTNNNENMVLLELSKRALLLDEHLENLESADNILSMEEAGSNELSERDDNYGSLLEERNIHDFLDPFQSAISIDGVELSWTLGRAMLYASSQIPPQSYSSQVDVGYIPVATFENPHYVLGGEILNLPSAHIPPFSSPLSSSSLSSKFVFLIFIVFCFVIFAYTNVFSRRFGFSSFYTKLRHISYPLWSSLYRCTGKSVVDVWDRDSADADRLLEEGGWDGDISGNSSRLNLNNGTGVAMKSYNVSPSESMVSVPRRMKSAFNLGRSTSMLDITTNNAPSRVSSRLGMRPDSSPRPMTSFELRDVHEDIFNKRGD